jgi:chemotaxis protein MotB
MARRKKHEEHVNAEAWAIPYGDLVTLLFALFTVMYAVSSVNEGKFRVLSDSMIAAFRGAPKSVKPINIGDKESGQGGDKPLIGVTPTALLKIKSAQAGTVPDSRDRSTAVDTGASKQGGADNSGADVRASMEHQLQDAMQGLIAAKKVTIKRENHWLEVAINTDILFPSGSGGFSPEAQPILDRLAGVLRPFPNPIRVEGHTDDRPIRTAAFPSNWELSAARAASVVHQFMQAGIDPLRLEIVGFGEFRPLQPNDSVVGRNANRRVSILILDQTAANDAATERARDITANSAGSAAAPAADAPGAENRAVVQVPTDELEKTVLIKPQGKTP